MARGSITPRPTQDGKMRYRIKWESRGPDGKRRYHSKTLATKKEAERFLADKLKEVNDGTFVSPSNDTLSVFLDRWLAASSSRWQESTAFHYAGVIRKRIKPNLGHIPLARLDELTIQEFYAKLLEAGYAPSSVKGTHTILHRALKQAVTWKLLPRNPAHGLTVPHLTTKPPRVWTAEEAASFLEFVKEHRFAPLWRLALDSGMRIGEILALDWRDLDFNTGMVSVRRTLTRTKHGGYKIGELAKTLSSRRPILLARDTLNALRPLRAEQNERRLKCGAAWNDLGLIFDRGDGRPTRPAVVGASLERAIKQAGVPPLTLHSMRHTTATLLLTAGIHPKIVQERLGHSSIQMTLDRYSHVTPSMQQDAASILNRLLANKARPKRGHQAG